jgi:hypothetical protein
MKTNNYYKTISGAVFFFDDRDFESVKRAWDAAAESVYAYCEMGPPGRIPCSVWKLPNFGAPYGSMLEIGEVGGEKSDKALAAQLRWKGREVA